MFWIPKTSGSNVLRHQSHPGELFYYQWSVFHQVIWEGLQIFFITFSGLQDEVFLIFKLLNSTEAAYDNMKNMTENRTSCGSQGWLKIEKMAACQEQSTYIIISYITW